MREGVWDGLGVLLEPKGYGGHEGETAEEVETMDWVARKDGGPRKEEEKFRRNVIGELG